MARRILCDRLPPAHIGRERSPDANSRSPFSFLALDPRRDRGVHPGRRGDRRLADAGADACSAWWPAPCCCAGSGVATLLRMRAELAARPGAGAAARGRRDAAPSRRSCIILPGFVTDLLGICCSSSRPCARRFGGGSGAGLQSGRAQRRESAPAAAPVIDLDRSEYAADARGRDSPWRRDGRTRGVDCSRLRPC